MKYHEPQASRLIRIARRAVTLDNLTRSASVLFAALFLAVSAAAQGGATTTQPVTRRASDAEKPARIDQQVIDGGIAEDANVANALGTYRARVAELSKPIARLDTELEKKGIGGGNVGNFVADAMRAEAARRSRRPISMAIVNTGGLRKNSIAAGALTTSDIYELLPFDNSLVVVELDGERLLRLLTELVKARDAQSGAVLTFTSDADDRNPRLVSAALDAGKGRARRIDPKKIYTIVTLDYLVDRGGNYAVLKEARRVEPLNVVLRDSVIEHLRRETAGGRAVRGELDGRFRRADAAREDRRQETAPRRNTSRKTAPQGTAQGTVQ